MKNHSLKLSEKPVFDSFFGFYCLKYFKSLSVKTKAFRKFFFTNLLRIKCSTNSKNLVKIGCSFCTYVWDSKGLPIRKMDFFTLSDFKKREEAG
jgi:hypothetical protein